MKTIAIFFTAVAVCYGDWTQETPNPYNHQYSAGQFPGYVDRTQSQTGGYNHGTTSYGYPNMQMRNVEYGDDNYYHPKRHDVLFDDTKPSGSAPSPYTDSVQLARNRHFYLYNKIAGEHAALGAQRG